MLRRYLAIFAVLTLSACSRFSYELGTPFGEETRAQVARVETLRDALERLGPPQRISAMPGGYVLAWEYWQIGEQTLGVSLGAVGAEAMSVDWGTATLSGEFLILHFDAGHRLLDYAFSSWDEIAGSGAAIQPSLAGVDVVDVSDLRRPMPQHRWGAETLRGLPATLNSASGPDSGEAALEQRGTPSAAGQRSMSWED